MKTVPDRLGHWEWYKRLPLSGQAGIALVLGAIAALGQAPFNQPIVMLLSFALVFLILGNCRRRGDAGLIGWSLGVGYFGVALFWIVEPFQIDPDRHAWMAPFALAFMSMGLALFWSGAFWFARYLSSRTWPLVFTWTAAEVLRAYLFTGFPWASPAQALVSGAAGQGLAWGGPHGVMLWLMSIASALSFPLAYRKWRVLGVVQLVLLCSATALFYKSPSASPSATTGHWVRLIQPNAAQHLKWQPDFVQSFFDQQLRFTAAAPKEGALPPSLTVWPETSIPWALDQAQLAFDQIASSARGQTVALGLLRRSNGALYNSMAVLDATGAAQQIYDKHHLVPFGEYIPFGHFLTQFGITGLAQSSAIGFAGGPGPQVLDFGVLGLGVPLICYEAVFAHGLNTTGPRADFLLQITNDAWFGQNAGPQQHLAQARMRAIEQGLPLMRSANTGISAMIDPKGRVLASLPMGVAGFLDAPLPAPGKVTLYGRTGDIPIIVLLTLVLLSTVLGKFRR
ncbi:apolipoprotein N-acyltransferase [Roseobacter sp.]|uniref:apolipoprotein N-acyltransferase n=1 Tax=Roseobacter sp. TaxID=1907202 RepID=UPI00385819CC